MIGSVHSIDYAFMQLQQTLDTTFTGILQDHQALATQQKQQRDKLHEALCKELAEKARLANSTKVYSALLTAAKIVGAVFAIAVGAACVATGVGSGAGVALIASGVVLLATEIASKLDLFHKAAVFFAPHDQTLQRRIEWYLNLGISLAATVASVVSLVFGNVGSLMEIASKVVQAVVGVATGTAYIGRGITDKEMRDHEAERTLVETKLDNLRMEQKLLQDREKEAQETWLATSKQIARAMELEHRTALSSLT